MGHEAGVRDLIANWAMRAGDRVAVRTTEGASCSYGDLHAMVLAAQDAASRCGIGPGDRVAIALPNSIDYIVWFFAILQSRATAVPVDPRLPDGEGDALLKDARCRYRIAMADAPPPSPVWNRIGDSGACRIESREDVPPPQSLPDDIPVLVQFSSGSSNRPKPIVRMESQIVEDYSHFCAERELGADLRYLGLLPLYHAYGNFGLMATVAVGGVLMPVKRFMPAAVIESARSFAPTLLLTTPQMINALSRCHLKPGQEKAFATVRDAMCGGAALAAEDHQRFLERFGVAIKIQYGATETLSVSYVKDGSFSPGRVGQAYPGVELAIFDDAGQKLPPMQVGRVGVRSAGCCTGYGPDAAEPVPMIDGFVLPGDMGFLDAAGELNLAGRDNVINIGGYKVSPAEVETLIAGAFATGYVKILPYSRGGVPALRAVIESTDPRISSRAVIDLCRQQLRDYKVPARVDVFASLPRNDTGKVTLSTVLGMLGDD